MNKAKVEEVGRRLTYAEVRKALFMALGDEPSEVNLVFWVEGDLPPTMKVWCFSEVPNDEAEPEYVGVQLKNGFGTYYVAMTTKEEYKLIRAHA